MDTGSILENWNVCVYPFSTLPAAMSPNTRYYECVILTSTVPEYQLLVLLARGDEQIRMYRVPRHMVDILRVAALEDQAVPQVYLLRRRSALSKLDTVE